MMKHKEARLYVDRSQFPQLLILYYIIYFPICFQKGGKGKGGGEGEHKKYLLHLKNGGKGKELCLRSPHATSFSDGTMILLK